MLELGAGADIFHGLGWLYVGLITILVGASLWFAFLLWREKSWARKSVVYILRLGMLMSAGTALMGCDKPVNYNDMPVSYWADPNSLHADGVGYADDCSLASAQAILKSGLPYPNYGTKDELASDGVTIKKRITTVDYWLGGMRFVFPAEVATSSSYPEHNPHRYRGLTGSLPHFYPKGEHAPVKDGMGAMVEVTFDCTMNPNANWFVYRARPRSNEEGIQQVKADYEAKAAVPGGLPSSLSKISINRRDDIHMVEVLYDRGGIHTNGQPMWEATYWPLNRQLKGSFKGDVSPIRCAIRHDHIQKRYGGVGHTCGTYMQVTDHVSAGISIYVSHLDQMPAIFDQVQQLIINAKKAGE